MLKLRLDIFDVIMEFANKGLAREPQEDDDDEDIWYLWTKNDFSLHGRFINYDLTDNELLMNGEVTYLQHRLEALLNNDIQEDCTISFAEPDFSFNLYPARRLYSIPGKISYRNGYMDRELYAEMTVHFWCREGGLGSNFFILTLGKYDIEAFVIYLKTVRGELTEEDETVRKMIQAGILVRE